MELYFSPLACSLAARIVLYEVEADARFVQVDTRTKQTRDGEDFFAVNPMGKVPTLRTDDGTLLSENPAILQFLGETFPQAGLVPADPLQRTRMRQWLSFIGSELHEGVFYPQFDPRAPAEAKAYALGKAKLRFDRLNAHLDGRDYLLDELSVADALLFTVLNWTYATEVRLADWPAVKAYHARLAARPAFARAFAEERALYEEEQARRAKQ